MIYIDQNEEVTDEAVISFTDTFYDNILRQEISIPEAFQSAKLIVGI